MAAPTAGSGAEQDQYWPLPKFYFSVDIGDYTDLPFQEVSGLDVETEAIEYRHGNSPVFSAIKMPGMMKYADVTLKKGVFNEDNEFLYNKWYFDEIYDILFVKSSKKFGLFLWKFFDLKIIDGFGPDGISALIKKFSIKANKFQSGFIYQYAFVMLLGFSVLLTFLIVK